MDTFDLDFYEYSMICDDPKLLEKLENTYYDPEYEAWEKEFDEEQVQEHNSKNSNVEMPDPDTVSWSGKSQRPSTPSTLEAENDEGGIETYDDIDDWEKEE